MSIDAIYVPDPTEPSVDDLQADEGYGIPLVTPVRIVGPVEVHQLPKRGGSVRRWTVDSTVQKVLGEDLRRARAHLLSLTQPFYFAHTMAQAQSNTAAKWPALKPLEITSVDPLWVRVAANIVVDEAGIITTSTGTNPAAGAEISETVPAGEEWELLAVRMTLVTDATVPVRQVSLVIDDGANNIMRIPAVSSQAASLTVAYNWVADAGYAQAAISTNVVNGFPRLRLPAGYRIRTTTGALVAGDDFGAPVLHYVKRSVGTASTELLVVEENWAH